MTNKKPEYIVKLEERDNTFYSVIHFHFFSGNASAFFKEKNFLVVFQNGSVSVDGKYTWIEEILETKQKFYLYIKNIADDKDKSSVTIYYIPDQFNEVVFFINNIIKQFRDATVNNRRTETKD